MNMHKVENHDHLLKDPSSGAVLLTDRKIADEYIMKKKKANEMKNLIEDVQEMKNEFREIKELLKRIINA